jgi:hypothetical protein
MHMLDSFLGEGGGEGQSPVCAGGILGGSCILGRFGWLIELKGVNIGLNDFCIFVTVTMQELAAEILGIIKDYRNDSGIQLTEDDIINWVNQFDGVDRVFMLEEFLHILKHGIYISKQKAFELLEKKIQWHSTTLKYPDVKAFLSSTVFLKMQGPNKSQTVLIEMLDELLKKKFGITTADCGTFSKENFIYIDDILATGNTIMKDVKAWLNANDIDNRGNYVAVTDKKVRLIICVFASHTWASDNLRFHLSSVYSKSLVGLIKIASAYCIENNVKEYNPALNLAYPDSDQPNHVKEYLQTLKAENGIYKHEDRAYRATNSPSNENFFRSPETRKRFEDIMLQKGIEILSKVNQLGRSLRPLGCCRPEYKTFGTGTLYFTWRNISNTCPLVFWWDNKAHGWKGLFPLQHRGN